MQIATFVLAVTGVVLSAASLTWQARSFALTGGRVRVTLGVGAFRESGVGMVQMPAEHVEYMWSEKQRADGYGQPVLVIQVHHTGRMAVTIEQCQIVMSQESPRVRILGGQSDAFILTPTEDGLVAGPPLPHRMEPGSASEMWCVEADEVIKFAALAKDTLNLKSVSIFVMVELGDGRTRTTSEILRL